MSRPPGACVWARAPVVPEREDRVRFYGSIFLRSAGRIKQRFSGREPLRAGSVPEHRMAWTL